MAEGLDFYYSPEVEEAVVTLCWHQPQLLGKVLRVIDPKVHILQEHLRFILEALQLNADLLGEADFTTVVQALREAGQFEACGELVGLEALFSKNYGYETLLDYYLELLKLYAAKRRDRVAGQVVVFSGGKGTIALNKEKHDAKDPDYVGRAFIRGRKYRIVGWTGKDKEDIHFYYYGA